MDPFPDPKEVAFNSDLQTIDEQNAKFFALKYPTNEFISKFPYIHAVDNDPLTCWNSFKVPQVGDSFGLQFVKATPLRKMTVTSSKSLQHIEGKFAVVVSDQVGEEWTTCHHTTRFPFQHTMTLEISCPSAPNLPRGMAHNVRIQFEEGLEKSLEVCGMDVGGMVL
ncbi:hypothetical protein EDD21DRAFT_73661 [Dissophora ornata]|nr:hypothetical protein EDD21DRAFT_73661 [Dissophora ornata]